MRVRAAQALAFIALVAALLGAIGPAERTRTTYAWPPRALPEGRPSKAWYTPLLLARHRPEAVTATVPCSLPAALADATRPVTVLATARHPAQAGGLALLSVGDQLLVRIGERVIDQVGLRAPRERKPCLVRVHLEHGQWLVEGGARQVAHRGDLAELPRVNGLFSSLDLRAVPTPAIEVTTAVHAARTTGRQAVAWTIAALAIVVGMLLLLAGRTPRRPVLAIRRAARAARRNAQPVDAIVTVGLAGWWVIAPVFVDDGWIMAKQSLFAASRTFSTYYVFLGIGAPLGYWLDWAQHWAAQSTNVLVFLRLPSVLCLAFTWVLCRWCLSRVVAHADRRADVARWALATTFLVGAFAWGTTLRPEPVTALLVIVVMACVLRFVERETAAPAVIAALCIPLAISAHPSGIVALAPLLAVAPRLLRFARSNLPETTALVAASVAVFTLLAFVGADVDQRRDDTQAIRALSGSTESWYTEPSRYQLLSESPYGTPLRRGSVALMALALLAHALRRRGSGKTVLNLPAVTLGLGLLLLIPAPSKWPSHFGTLLGLAALAVAAEAAGLERAARDRRPLRGLVVVGAAVVATAWSWSVRGAWNPGDLRTLNWSSQFEGRVSLTLVAAALPLILLVTMASVSLARGDDVRLRQAPWRAAAWTGPVLAVPLILFTASMLAADTARTPSWTMGRQSLGALTGHTNCGLAEDLLIRRPIEAGGELEPFAERLGRTTRPSLVLPSLVPYFECSRLPELRDGVVEAPRYIVTFPNPFSPIRFPGSSPFVGVFDLYEPRLLPFSTVDDPPRDVLLYDVDEEIPGAEEAPADKKSSTS